MTSHQLSAGNTQRHVILSQRRRIYLISHPDLSGFLIFYICALIFNMNVKMQNEPKLKSPKIPVIPYKLSINKTTLRPPQPKNEPKQTQIDTKCHLGRSEVLWTGPRAGIQNKISHPDSSGFHILECREILRMPDAYCLLPAYKKMTSKPNSKISKITLSDFLNKTNDYSPTTNDYKSKPKQTQFSNKMGFNLNRKPATSKDFRNLFVKKRERIYDAGVL